MAVNFPGVPFAAGLLPQNINEQIARGPDLSWIGNVPTDFFQGLEAGYQQRQRDLFKGGLPRDAQGNIDYQKMAEQVVQAGGAPAAEKYLPYGLTAEAMRNLPTPEQPPPPPPQPPASGAAAPGLPPSTAGGARPATPAGAAAATPSTTDEGFTPGQIAAANPLGVPQAVAQPTPAAQVQARFPQPTSPAIPPNAAPAQPGLARQPAPPTAPPTQVAQQQPLPPMAPPPEAATNEAMAARYQQIANRAYQQAAAIGTLNPAASQRLGAIGDMYAKAAEQYRGSALKTAEPTEAEKNLARGTERGTLLQKTAIDRGEKLYRGIEAAASQYETDLKQYNNIARSILNRPELYTGIGADAVLDMNKLRAVWGNRDPAQLQEMLEKVRASSVLSQINTQKDQMQEAGANSSRIFSAQVDQVMKASPGLENTLAGNRALVNIQTKMGDLQTEIARQARIYRAQHGYLDDGFDQQISDFLQRNPVFSKQEQAHPQWLGAPDAPPGLSTNDYVRWGARMGLKPGDVVRAGGQYMKIPNPSAAGPQ